MCFAESRCRVFYHPQRTDGGLLRLCSGEDQSICKCAEGKPNHNHSGNKLWNMFIDPFQAHQKHSMVTKDYYLLLFLQSNIPCSVGLSWSRVDRCVWERQSESKYGRVVIRFVCLCVEERQSVCEIIHLFWLSVYVCLCWGQEGREGSRHPFRVPSGRRALDASRQSERSTDDKDLKPEARPLTASGQTQE